jgi:serine/threonine protein kinase
LQYGVLADIYSLAIILFELFSGIDPFPGNMGQIWQAKAQDKKPEIPSEFPTALKNLIIDGWSKKNQRETRNTKVQISFECAEKGRRNQTKR